MSATHMVRPVVAKSSLNRRSEAKPIFVDSEGGHPPVQHYRQEVFDDLAVNPEPCSFQEAVRLLKSKDLDLQSCNICFHQENVFQKSKASVFYGKQSFRLGCEWQAIASLSPHEIITDAHLEPRTVLVEIQYSKRDNLYYIRSRAESMAEVVLDFLVKIPSIKKVRVPPWLKERIADYSEFSLEPAVCDTPNPTGEDYLDFIVNHEIGTSYQRALAFKDELHEKRPEVMSRIVMNDYYCFVEVNIAGCWICCDLGGESEDVGMGKVHEPGYALSQEGSYFQAHQENDENLEYLEAVEQEGDDSLGLGEENEVVEYDDVSDEGDKDVDEEIDLEGDPKFFEDEELEGEDVSGLDMDAFQSGLEFEQDVAEAEEEDLEETDSEEMEGNLFEGSEAEDFESVERKENSEEIIPEPEDELSLSADKDLDLREPVENPEQGPENFMINASDDNALLAQAKLILEVFSQDTHSYCFFSDKSYPKELQIILKNWDSIKSIHDLLEKLEALPKTVKDMLSDPIVEIRALQERVKVNTP